MSTQKEMEKGGWTEWVRNVVKQDYLQWLTAELPQIMY